MIISEKLAAIPFIRHGFFTRKGGVSDGIYSSLNCGPGSSDRPENVKQNRSRVAAQFMLSEENLCTLHQVHGANVVEVEKCWELGKGPQADGMVTKIPHIALGILTADCAPVLLADGEKKIIAAAHAGWKCAKSGIIEHTIEKMLKGGANTSSIVAAIGPCIGFMSYEVGPEFRDNFLNDSKQNDEFFAPAQRTGHFMFNLTAFVSDKLKKSGISKIDMVGHDTLRDEENFFSFRRTTLQGEKDYGRQISVITLLP